MIISTDIVFADKCKANSDLLAQANRMLAAQDQRLPLYVSCELASDGTLKLHGAVPTYYLKQMAQEAVCGLGDGTTIVNGITVSNVNQH